MGDCESVTFWGEWVIAITWSDSTLLKQHIVELPEISTRNFFGKQTQGNNKHAEISCSSLSPPASGRYRKISLVFLSDVDKWLLCGLASHTYCFTSSRTSFVKRIYFWKYLSNQCFMVLTHGSRILLILWAEIKLLGSNQWIHVIIY